MTILLPESLSRWVAERAALLGYASPDAYVADLLQREVAEIDSDGPDHLSPKTPEELERMLLEGCDQEPRVAEAAFWEEQRRKLSERRVARNQAESQ